MFRTTGSRELTFGKCGRERGGAVISETPMGVQKSPHYFREIIMLKFKLLWRTCLLIKLLYSINQSPAAHSAASCLPSVVRNGRAGRKYDSVN